MAGGDVDYAPVGAAYTARRRPDPRIAALVHDALGPAGTVVNVGAGAGSYEPADRFVVAVEPSAAMRGLRAPEAGPCVGAVAEALPFDDDAFDAAMAMVTIHQWADWRAGVCELRRVAAGPVVVLSFDGSVLDRYWLAQYVPELLAHESNRVPPVREVAALLGPDARIVPVAVPADCVDGFMEAYYARPEAFLDPGVRRAQSAWTFAPAGLEADFVARLGADLASGRWDERFGEWRTWPQFHGSVRLVVG